MKLKLALIAFLFSLAAIAQNEQLAQNYFDKGEFEKAKVSYQELLKNQPSNSIYFQRLVESFQQLQQLEEAEKLLRERLERYKQGGLLVEIGYNYQLKKDDSKAKKYYEEALAKIKVNAGDVYSVASSFEKRSLLDYALRAYKLALEKEPKMNFNYQMALLYGQQGNTDMMINTFLDEAFANPHSTIVVQNQLSRFMNEDADTNFNETLRKALLVRAQKDQDIFWNQYLSWFYVQQKEYGKAFVQEKAVYKRNPETFYNIVNLAELAIQEDDSETAKEIFGWILQNTSEIELRVQANFYLMEMRVQSATEKENAQIEADFKKLMDEFGLNPFTLQLQILYAHFTAFNANNPEAAKNMLRQSLELQLNRYQQSDVKMELADILLYEEKFNQALIYYSQIEDDLKNDAIGHEASLKSARTSYFKGDFTWAQAQFKTLKSASTQLIANDALEYFLLISDNTVEDSTQTALKKFARADYLLYQNKSKDALAAFQAILQEFKGKEIESVTMLRLGKMYEKAGDFNAALNLYKSILDNHADGIYVDEALYYSADIYNFHLKEPERAKPLYEKMIFEHQDSIHFVEARKKYRTLRGDTNL
ncbi:tetratricopeptide repeat protein [Flavobacterium selenitireducens]|uniref:tetratricopeptide repeat protein n=1 Tax=Flavobacterium selenitireducens TaxID=2722704 RepID=UPI00168BB68C|nr:tetratricopeptide repeat protein [Flavobacterium selenitireducens]MBD3581759.1 tetratricopeptide repeat protein [Flavobacterium selenitireducens]